MRLEISHYLPTIRWALSLAEEERIWIVVVTPDSSGPGLDKKNACQGIQAALSLLCPSNARMCGRTLIFENGARVTVTGYKESPMDGIFFYLPVGFDFKLLPAEETGLRMWRNAAFKPLHVLHPIAKTGLLV